MTDDWRREPADDAWADHDWDDGGAGDPEFDDGYGAGYDDYDLAEGEWVEHRGPVGRGRKLLTALAVVVVLVVVVAGGAFVWVQGQIDPSGEPGAEVEVEIAQGSTTEDIGSTLSDAGVISSSMVWDYWTRLNDEGPFQAGLYRFRENSSFDEAVAVLDAGPVPPESFRVTVPEGLTVSEIVPHLADPETGVERWSAEALGAALQSGQIRSRFQPPEQPSMEGMLLPETYDIGDDTDEAAFLQRMVTQLDETLVALEVEAKAAALGRSPYEIVVIASLIEEEARVPEERAKISRVIHNRLAQGIPLGIDATSRYEAEISGRSRDDLDFESDSPYNTRRIAGVPPTPIAAAGRASLEAALNPEPGDWIYYVLTDAEGHHTFAVTAAEFQEAKQLCIERDLGCG